MSEDSRVKLGLIFLIILFSSSFAYFPGTAEALVLRLAPPVKSPMPVLAPRVTISVSDLPRSQTVVSGTAQFHFASYLLDTTRSDDDVRFINFPAAFITHENSIPTNLTSCQLYDGARSVTTGNNAVNPVSAASSTVFTFDGNGLIVPRGGVKKIDLKCNIAGGSTGVYSWGFDISANPRVVGVSLNIPAEVTKNPSSGQRMTVLPGGKYVVIDDSSPSYRIVNAAATGVELLRLRFAAFDENIAIQRVSFQLSGFASNTPVDLVSSEVKLYDGITRIGTAQFTANGDYATSTLLSNFIVPKDGFRTMIIKGDIAAIGTSGPLFMSGDFLKVDYDGDANGINGGNYGIGVSSGTTISPTSSDTSVQGVRLMKAYPEFTKLSVPSNILTNGDNSYPLYRFSIKAKAGDVHIFKLSFNVSETRSTGPAPTHATTSKYSLYSYTDSAYSVPDMSAPGNSTLPGLINGGQCYGNGDGVGLNNHIGLGGSTTEIEIISSSGCSTATTTYRIPSGVSRYLELRANVKDVEAVSGVQDSIEIRLLGDSAFPISHQCGSNMKGDMGFSGVLNAGGICSGADSGVNADQNDDFIWSPGSLKALPGLFDVDFTNGYMAPGLPADYMAPEIFTSAN